MRPMIALLAAALAASAADAPPAVAPPTPPAPSAGTAPAPVDAARPLKLADVIRLSAASSGVKLAQLDIAVAQGELGGARSDLLPNLSATGTGQRGDTYLGAFSGVPSHSDPINTFDGRLRLGQALIDLGTWNRACAADHRLAAARAGSGLALQDAAADAADAYVALAQAQEQMTVRARDQELAADLLRLAKAQVEVGAAEPIAVTRAEKRLADARAAASVAEGDARRSAIRLARALFVSAAQPVVAADALDPELGGSDAPEDTDRALAAAAERRPELALGAEQLAAADADRRAARGRRLPRLNGFADIGRIGTEPDDTVTTWEAGVALTVPLLDRSRSDEQAAAARAARERVRLEDVHQRVEAEVRDALAALSTSRASLKASAEAKALAVREVEQARARFSAGAVSNLELIDAQRGLAAADDALIGARRAVVSARVRLARAVGVATTLH